MSTLSMEPYVLPAASMGKDSPLPDLSRAGDAHAAIQIDRENVTEEESRYMGWGRVNGILPYTLRDGYNRVKRNRAFQAMVLRNEHLEAVFLPELGGKLWSLIDRDTGRELLQRNPVFQPCNLALRNAWTSGGVEWNCGIIGHHPYTVDPMHTQRLTLKNGTPVLRMYQYERVRGLVYRIEALLPDRSHHLIVRMRIDNVSKKDTAVYWWSNIAAVEREDVRVIVPATRAFQYGYGGKLTKVPVPVRDGVDVTHSTNFDHAIDFFFDIPDGQRRFIAAVGQSGYGLCQTSTDRLVGRKLFLWGMGAGGRNWQTFLSEKGQQYIEIQAGLGHTQLEHLPMKGGETIVWTEAYGAIQVSAEAAQSEDWGRAVSSVSRALERELPRKKLEKFEGDLAELDALDGETVLRADGFGALESLVRPEDFDPRGLRFDLREIGKNERPWYRLLKNGVLPCPDPKSPPLSYQVSDPWMEKLTASLSRPGGDHWCSRYHLAVMKYYRADFDGARAEIEKSLAFSPSPWALRCRALLEKRDGSLDKAADDLLAALALLAERHLAVEALQALLDANRAPDAVAAARALPHEIARLGRVKALLAEALVAADLLDEAEEILRGNIVVADVREGEVKLTDLWFLLCAKRLQKKDGGSIEDCIARAKSECPPPKHLDFRMNNK